MKLTWISEYEARPGQLIEWRLHPTTIAAASQLAPDARPPSYMQEAHMRTAAFLRDLAVEAPTWLGTAFDVRGALDVDALEAALLQWIARHETLRSGLRLAGEELERFTLSAEAVSLDRIVVDHFSQGADVVRYVEDRFDEATNPLTWPTYLFVTVGREDGFTVYLAFDHSNVDGYSIARIPHEIHELYASALSGRPAEPADVGSYVDFSKIERDCADEVDAEHESVVRWREFVETCGGGLPAFPLDLGVAPGELPRQTGVCEWLLDPAEAKAFGAACKAAGGNFLAGILATVSIVAYERGDQPVYRTVLPFHTRSEWRWSTSLGWYIGLAPVEIATAHACGFRELIGMARDAARAAKPAADVPFAKVCTLLGAAVRPLSMISYMDGRTIPGAARWGEWEAHAFGKVSYGDDAFVWVNRAIDGLYMTCRYPDTDLAHQNITGFLEHTREVLRSVATSGTYSFVDHLLPEQAVA
ncbi:MAG: condensation domain-containing protein [Actinomycetota bacterium]|nr:condensation domain-containing protein [Actinomycetota bacterium]